MNAQEKIIKALKEEGRLPTNRIAGIAGLNYGAALNVLDRMHQAGIIYFEKETNATYWMLEDQDDE